MLIIFFVPFSRAMGWWELMAQKEFWNTKDTCRSRKKSYKMCHPCKMGLRKHEDWEDSAWRLSSDVRVRSNRHISWNKKYRPFAFPLGLLVFGRPLFKTAFGENRKKEKEKEKVHLFQDLARFQWAPNKVTGSVAPCSFPYCFSKQ